MKVQVFSYQVLLEASLEDLIKFKDHRRLRVFYYKGTNCVNCDKVGTRLVKGMDGGGNMHWDVYTEDLFPLTIDHILPKSLGGSDDLDNLQPMCAECNFSKGNGQKQQKKVKPVLVSVLNSNLTANELIGKVIWKKRRNTPVGKVHSITVNPHTKLPTATIEGNSHSFHDLRTLYIAV